MNQKSSEITIKLHIGNRMNRVEFKIQLKTSFYHNSIQKIKDVKNHLKNQFYAILKVDDVKERADVTHLTTIKIQGRKSIC